jgi:hypothetical protein
MSYTSGFARRQYLFANALTPVVGFQEAATSASSGNSSLGVGWCLCMLPAAACSSCVILQRPQEMARWVVHRLALGVGRMWMVCCAQEQ